MIKLIVCDLDGTLLNDRKQLDSQILPVLDALRKKHILFLLWPLAGMKRLPGIMSISWALKSLMLRITAPIFTVAIGYCKVKAYKKKDSEWILTRLMEEGIPFTFFDQQCGYSFSSSKKLNEIRGLFSGRLKLKQVRENAVFADGDIYKLTLDSAEYPDIENLVREVTEKCPKIAFKRSEDSLYTITAAGTSKGQALKSIAGALKIELCDVLSIGDNFNDIAMFEISGHSVAMGNSDSLVKQSADEVTLSHNENGVSQYLIRKLLNSKEELWTS